MYRNILSRKVLAYLAAFATIFLTSGGVYLFVMKPGAIVSTSTGTGFIVKSSMSQTSTEFFAAFFMTVAGMAGFLMLESALQRSFDLSGSKMKYLIGISLVIIAIGIMEFIVYAKFN